MKSYPADYPIIQVRDLQKRFPVSGGRKLHAIDGVSFDLRPGRTLALVGESGSGKSTVARCITRLLEPSGGEVVFHGNAIGGLTSLQMSLVYRSLQMVFQDPTASLNPRMTVRQILEEPLRLHMRMSREERRARVEELIVQIGLSTAHLDRYPNELSGGQRQRIGIARAIATNPDVVLLDEPTASLDVSVRGNILELLRRIQVEMNLAYLLISHDLQVVRYASHDVAVMYLGKIVEYGTTEQVFTRPRHPYTRALMAAAPEVRFGPRPPRIRLTGEIGTPVDPKPGCRLCGRCPIEQPECSTRDIPLVADADGHAAACSFHHLLTAPTPAPLAAAV